MANVFDEARYLQSVLLPMLDAFGTEGLPDVFTRYDIAIDCNDDSGIASRIDAVEAFWQNRINNSKFAPLLKQLLRKEERAKAQDLRDPQKRASARESAKEGRRERLAKRYAKLAQAIRPVAAKGYLTQAEREQIVTSFERELSRAEVEAHIKAIPVKESPPVAAPAEGLSQQVRDNIKMALAVLKEADLYKFLKVSEVDGEKEWQAAYERAKSETDKLPPDNLKTARGQLLGILKSHILVGGGLERYRQAQRYSILVDQLDLAVNLAAMGGRIDSKAFQTLVATATKNGLKQKEAEDGVIWLASKHKAAVETGAAATAGLSCPVCYCLVADERAEACPNCRSPLWRNCSKCKMRYFAGTPTCSKCHYPYEDQRLKVLLRHTEEHLAAGDSELAGATLRQAEEMWTGPETNALRAQVAVALDNVNQWARRCVQAMQERRFVALSRLLDLPPVDATYKFPNGMTLAELCAATEKKIDKAAEIAKSSQIKLANHRSDEAVLGFESALAVVADLAEAEKGLAQCRPTAPGNVIARIEGEAVQLTWTASSSVGQLSYAIQRAAEDGILRDLGVTEEKEWLDKKTQAGSVYRYSVRSVRHKTLSDAAEARVMAVLPVQNASVQARPGAVTGSWTPLPSGAQVTVRRMQGQTPRDIQQGDPVRATAAGFEDTGLVDDIAYHYLICALYRDAGGTGTDSVYTDRQGQKWQVSKPQIRVATPSAPPQAVNELMLTDTPQGLEITWPAPARGTVTVYRSQTRIPAGWASGKAISVTEMNAWGTPIAIAGPNRTQAIQLPAGVSFFVPLTVNHDLSVMGAAREFVDLADVVQLKALNLNKYIQLSWEWPAACQFVHVAWRKDQFPVSAADPQAKWERCTRGQYFQLGGFRINEPAAFDYYFCVFAGFREGERDMFSGCVTADSRAALKVLKQEELPYAIKRKMLSKSVTIELDCKEHTQPVPDIVIVGRKGDLQPISKTDGRELARIKGGPPPIAPHRFEVPDPRPVYIRAFLDAPTSAYVLRDPRPDELKFK